MDKTARAYINDVNTVGLIAFTMSLALLSIKDNILMDVLSIIIILILLKEKLDLYKDMPELLEETSTLSKIRISMTHALPYLIGVVSVFGVAFSHISDKFLVNI